MNEQKWNAEQYNENASFVSELGNSVLELLNPKSDEVILDVGCGDGTLTQQIANMSSEVIGIDSSESMVESTSGKGINCSLMSADAITFENKFDAVFTNAALHWVKDHNLVLKGVCKSLKAKGRFVGEFGGYGNIQTLVNAMKRVVENNPKMGTFSNPWYFPTVSEYSKLLTENDFYVEEIKLIPRPTQLKTGVKEWLKIFGNYIISGIPAELEDPFLNKVECIVKDDLYSEKSGWLADYVRIRFKAQKI